MRSTIEWQEGKGKMVTVDLEDKVIIGKNGGSTPIKNDLTEVRRVFDKNIEYLADRLKTYRARMAQTETVRTPVPHGYSITEPLTENQREIFEGRIKEMAKDLKEIRALYKDYKVKPKAKKK